MTAVRTGNIQSMKAHNPCFAVCCPHWTGLGAGLHNLDNSSSAEALYSQLLQNFTQRLLQTGSKLAYITTTPYMCGSRVSSACGLQPRAPFPVAILSASLPMTHVCLRSCVGQA